MQDKFIVNVCLSGVVPSKKANPHLPVNAQEIQKDVESCVAQGASIVHIHARNEEGEPTWVTKYYQEILEGIRRVSRDIVICVSTSGRVYHQLEQRVACLDAVPRPDMASLTMGSINFATEAVMNEPQAISDLAHAMHRSGIKPEIEIFDIGMARTTSRLMETGLLHPPVYANIILGNVATADVSLLDLAAILQHLPKEVVWCVGGIGKCQLKANTLGILFGKGVRVGLEDNLYLDDAKTPATNAALVERVVHLGRLLGKTPASISETRECLGL